MDSIRALSEFEPKAHAMIIARGNRITAKNLMYSGQSCKLCRDTLCSFLPENKRLLALVASGDKPVGTFVFHNGLRFPYGDLINQLGLSSWSGINENGQNVVVVTASPDLFAEEAFTQEFIDFAYPPDRMAYLLGYPPDFFSDVWDHLSEHYIGDTVAKDGYESEDDDNSQFKEDFEEIH